MEKPGDGPPRGEGISTRRQILRWLAGSAGALLASGEAGSATGAGGCRLGWDDLRRRLGTKLVLRAEPAYENDRRATLWNAVKPKRFPDAIVHAASEADVAAAIRFAARTHRKVAVRGGGHHFSAPVLRQGGLLVDLSQLDGVSVDAATRTAVVQPAATGRRLIEALAPHGLAFPVGHCASVALSGYLLNGGFGWNGGVWGPACLSVQGVDVVTAGGLAIHVDAEHHPDLFWAARGAGIGFPGVVTRFYLAVHPLPRAIRTSTLTFAAADLDAVARWIPTLQDALPPQVELICLVVSPPPEAQAHGAPPRAVVVSGTAFADSDVDAERWLGPLDDGPPDPTPLAKTLLADTPFDALFDSIDGAFPAGFRYVSDHAWSNSTPAQLLASVREAVLSPPSPRDLLLLAFRPPSSPDAPPPPDLALSTSAATYVGVYGVWSDAAA